jgi:hypothetical protein
MAMERLDWLQFPRKKLTNLSYTCLTHYIHYKVHTDWLALLHCAASLPAVCTQVQEIPLLLSSNSPPTMVNSICPDISSPLLRYHDENIRRAHRSVPHSFPEIILVIMQKKDLQRHITA